MTRLDVRSIVVDVLLAAAGDKDSAWLFLRHE